ncbi:bifunctional hydroxymethylpyrimidine kinase/phosphomethylpyrimidine kinase [Archaeoglobales archaeon]|nr:MAG: bifunctional hydroxymethylpyrimidine kinase/phosphomethylpyrimidine kinase [Archaeoglobales archaeon]
MKFPSILTIAGFDVCGGAGIHADIKTISSIGFHPSSVITTITFQNTCNVYGIEKISADTIDEQISAVLDDLNIIGIKIGLVCDIGAAKLIAERIKSLDIPKVLDPVVKASVGFEFTNMDVYRVLANVCNYITPNASEASLMANQRIEGVEDAKKVAKKLSEEFGCSTIITGGSLDGKDVVYDLEKSETFTVEAEFSSFEIHGTGCVYSTALTCYLAKGSTLDDACRLARLFLLESIKKAKPVGDCNPVVFP